MSAVIPVGMVAKRGSNRVRGQETSALNRQGTEMVDQIYKCRDTVKVDGIDEPCRRTKIRVNGFRWVCPPECPNCDMSEAERRLYSASATQLFPNRQNSVERDYPPHSTA